MLRESAEAAAPVRLRMWEAEVRDQCFLWMGD